jgi:hypothetical protein
VARLGDEYDVSADDLRRALVELLEGLHGKRLVESR